MTFPFTAARHAHWLCTLTSGIVLAVACHAQQQPNPLRSALAHARYPEAVQLARQQIQAHPNDVLAWIFQALALNGEGKSADALASIRHALQLQPDSLPAAEAGAQIAYAAKDPASQAMLDNVLELDPANTTAHAMAGVLALERHDCSVARMHFDAAGAPPPAQGDTPLRLGICFYEHGDLPTARQILNNLHTAAPHDPAVAFDLASVDVDTHQFPAAIALLQAQRNDGRLQDSGSLNLLAAAYAGNDQVAEAIATYRLAIASAPDDDRNYIDLAILSMDHQSPAVALGVLDAGIQNHPNSASLYTMRGSVHAQVAQNEAAQADFETAERLAPTQSIGTIGLGVLLRDETNLDEAQHVLEAKLKSTPEDPVLNYMLSDILIRKGAAPGDEAFAEAKRLLERSLRRQPDLSQAHAALGKLDLKAGDLNGAIDQLEAAIRLSPTDRTALNQLVAAYRRVNRPADADRVAAQLSSAIAEERAEETDKNRVHLIIDAPAGQAQTGAPEPVRP